MNKNIENQENLIHKIKTKLGNNPELITKEYSINHSKVLIIYIENMVDGTTINDFILEYLSSDIKVKKNTNVFDFLYTFLPVSKVSKIAKLDEIIYNLLSGFTIILSTDNNKEVLSIETKAKLDSHISEAKNEKTIKGPKDSFSENYQINIGLIRKRLKSDTLRLEETVIGKISNTKVGIMYLDGIADKYNVKNIIRKIKKIHIDAVLDVANVVELISQNEKNVFPNFLETERPDYVTNLLLNGRIVIIVENCPYVAVIPAIIDDFIHVSQDFYGRGINSSINRFIRFTGFILTILTPAFYIAVTTYNHEAIPSQLLINFSIQRDGVPFASILEALLMIVTFEILKETDSRIPSTIGSSLSIVGALVLGEAAVAAGIVSPIMVIVIAITSISGLIISLADFTEGIRVWRIAFLVGAALAGVVGILCTGFIFIAYLSSIKSFGVPYTSNFAPFSKNNANNSLFLTFKGKYLSKNDFTVQKGGIDK